MREPRQAKTCVIALNPDALGGLLAQVRNALRTTSGEAVLLDLTRVSSVDPAMLRLLEAVGTEAQQARKDILVAGTSPVVYKALQIAKLGPLFKRLHHTTKPL